MPTTATSAEIRLKRLELSTAVIEIEGTNPLIVHQWSEKAKRMMLAAQQGKKVAKVAKDPKQDFLDSAYRFEGTDRDLLTPLTSHGFPTAGIKAAAVKGSARAFGKTVKMTELRQSLLFLPDGSGDDGLQLTRLVINAEPTPREDMVRVGMGTADIRYRAQYDKWAAVLRVEYLPGVIDLESVVAIVDAGGMNGIGEWRPEKNGSFGTFRVASFE
jgi:hypothetical protein